MNSRANDSTFLLSVVAPAFDEEDNLREFYSRINRVMSRHALTYEIVFVNDGSSDGTLAVMLDIRARNKNVTAVNLSRNFGKEIAMTAGLAYALGDAVVVIDTDLQDPPELIPEMARLWKNGADVVYAQRTDREGESWLKKRTAAWFYKLMRSTGPVSLPSNAGDYRLMDRRVARAVLQFKESHRFMKGLFTWVGFRQIALPYVRNARFTGKTKFNYWKLWNFAIEGVTSFTILPLKLATYAGVIVALAAILRAAYVAFKTLVFGDPVPGFTTIIVTMLLLGGIQLMVLGIMGEYLGRIFDETKRRPLYLVESVHLSEQNSRRSDRETMRRAS
jgi:glycosyltransferase involved in cell wall biosynthesis